MNAVAEEGQSEENAVMHAELGVFKDDQGSRFRDASCVDGLSSWR